MKNGSCLYLKIGTIREVASYLGIGSPFNWFMDFGIYGLVDHDEYRELLYGVDLGDCEWCRETRNVSRLHYFQQALLRRRLLFQGAYR